MENVYKVQYKAGIYWATDSVHNDEHKAIKAYNGILGRIKRIIKVSNEVIFTNEPTNSK